MKLAELKIKNFCCIGTEELTVNIDNIVVLIGPNNVGKTTVLRAYDAFASTGTPLSEDFFHKYCSENPIEISGTFSEISSEDIAKIGKKWIYSHNSYGNVITYKWVWKNPDEKAQKYSWNEEEKKWEEGGMGGWDPIIASCLPVPLKINPLDDSKSLESKIIEILTQAIKKSIKDDSSKINKLIDEFNSLAEDVKSEIESSLTEATDILKEKLQDVFPDHGVMIQPEAGKVEPEKIIGAGSHIRIIDPNGEKYPLDKQGAGLQRTFLWSAIESLAEIGRYKIGKKSIASDFPRILLIEEPEVFLHPPAIRAAREALYKLSTIPNWQVMISTHSPIFIDVSKPHTTIIRVEKDAKYGTKTFSTEKAEFVGDERERLQMIRACHPTINEFFFSDNIILVEGDTEQAVLNTLKKSYTKNKDIHIVNCMGKANIPLFQKILNHFGVNYTVFHDSDYPKCMRNGKLQKNSMWTLNEKIFSAAKSNPELKNQIIVNIPDFEGQYFGYLQKGDKPYKAILELSNKSFRASNQYIELIRLFDYIKEENHPRKIKEKKDYRIFGLNYITEKKIEQNGIWEFE